MVEITDDELRGILQRQFDTAIGEATSGRISERRMRCLQRYRGEPFGNERAGRSRVVSWDSFDVVESVLPSLLKIFASTDEIVEFEPVGQEDEAFAKQATDYINYVFLKDNNGFNVLSTWFKDALTQINGFVKVYWEESESWVEKRYTGMTAEQMRVLLSAEQEGEYIITEQTENVITLDDGTQIPVVDFRMKCRKVKKYARVVPCAPEDVGKAPGTTDLDDCKYSYHRCVKTVSELIQMGFDRDLVMEAVGPVTMEDDIEHATRAEYEDDFLGTNRNNEIDDSMREVVVTEHYIRMDYDGDGIAEYRIITTGGESQFIILSNEELNENPLVEITPIPLPHQAFGMALIEPAMPIEEVKTTVQRQLLDNFYCVNNAGHIIDQTKANENTIPDLLNAIPNRVVRANALDAVRPLETKPLGSEPFTLLEYMDTLLEQRTGVTRYNQGLDADSLNKTATGIQIIQNASQERLMLIAKHFGEGVRRMFGKLLRLTIRHQDIKRTVRLRNQWVDVDPRYWNMEMDVSVSVGLGTGNKDQMLSHLVSLYNMQKEMLQMGLITGDKILNTGRKTSENMGFKNTEAFFPTDEEFQAMQEQQAAQQAQAAAQPQTDPATAELEAQRLQFEQEKAAAEHQQRGEIEQAKIASNERIKMAEIQMKQGMEQQNILNMREERMTAAKMKEMEIAESPQTQAITQAAMSLAETAQLLAGLAAQLTAPKQVSLMRDDMGRMTGAMVGGMQ